MGALAVAASAQFRAAEHMAVGSTRSRLQCCSSHRQPLRSCEKAVVLLSWCLLLLLICMPCLVRGHAISRQAIPDYQDYLTISSDLDRNSPPPDILEGLERTDKQNKPPPGRTYQALTGLRPAKEKKDGIEQADSGQLSRKNDPTEDTEGKDGLWFLEQSRALPSLGNWESSISCSTLNLVQHVVIESTPPDFTDADLSVFQGALSTAPNVAIFPPLLEWGPRFLFSPSLGSLTIINTWNNSGLFVFQPFSTNSEFYTSGFQETTVPPGGRLSIHVVFLPRTVGLAEGLLVVQTSAGGFLIQIQGEGVESPYKLQPLPCLSAASDAKMWHSMTLHSPYDEPLLVEEVSLWIADSHKKSLSVSGPGADRGRRVSCKRDAVISNGVQGSVGSPDWIELPDDGESHGDKEDGSLRLKPSGQWEIEPHSSNPIVDLELTVNKEKGVRGALCMKVVHFMQQTYDSLILPLNVQPMETMSSHRKAHAVPEILDFGVLTQKEQESKQDVVLVNPGPDSVLVEKIYPSCEDGNILDIEYAGDLILHPGTKRRVATVTYVAIEQRTASMYATCHDTDFCVEFKLIVRTNSTMDPYVKVPYQALVLHGVHDCFSPDSSTGISKSKVTFATASEDMCKPSQDLQLRNGFNVPLFLFRDLEKTCWALELDEELQPEDPALNQELISNKLIFEESELLFPMTQVGIEDMRWVNVRNPSDKPVVMQLLVSSQAGASNCMNKKGVDCIPNHPMCRPGQSFDTIDLKIQETTKIQSGTFTIAEGGVVNVVVQPNGTSALGPIIFRPAERCVWTSLLILRNNLTRMEWMPVQGSGGSTGLTFLDGDDAVQILELDFNSTSPPLPMTKTIKQHIDEIFDDRGAKSTCHKRMFREFLAKNTGDFPLRVESMMLAGGGCGSHGFSIDSCHGFYLAPGQSTQLTISYQPDFTSGITQRDLQLATSFGMLTVPLRANLPGHISGFCYKALLVSKVKKFFLHVCLVALFSVLLVFVKMLKQERSIAPHRSQWPSASSADTLFHHVNMKTSGGGTYHDRERQKGSETPLFSTSNNFDSTSDLDRSFGQSETFSKAFGFLGVVATFIGSFVLAIRSMFGLESQGALPNINFKISTVGTPAVSLTKSNTGHSKQGNSSVNTSSRVSEKKCSVTHPRNHPSKSVNQPSSAMYTNGGSQLTSPNNSFKKESSFQQILSSKSQPVVQKVQPVSPKAGLSEKEKEKGKRKKRRNNIAYMKHEVESEGRSRSSSPLSSPTSPATSINSSRPVSPFFPSDSLSSTSMGPRAADEGETQSVTHRNSYGEHSNEELSQIDVHPSLGSYSSLHTERHPLYCTGLENTVVGCCTSPKISSPAGVISTQGAPVGNAGKCKEGNITPVTKDWGVTAQRGAIVPNSAHLQGSDQSWRAVGVGNTAKNRPALTTSATFPRGGRRSGRKLPVMEEVNTTWSATMSSPSLVSTSVIPPDARAPGTRISKQGAVSNHQIEGGGKVPGQFYAVSRSFFAESSNATDQGATDFVYDIWGDHFAEISRGTESFWSWRYTALEKDLQTKESPLLQDSHSLFSKSGFMMQVGTVCNVNNPVPCPSMSGSSDFSVFSRTDAIISSHPLEIVSPSHPSSLDPEQ